MPAPDIAVIGGGIVGVSAAVEAASRGATVVLHERATIAAGASGRNSGVVWHPADPVLDALYRESLARYRRLVDETRGLDAPFVLPSEPVGILTLGRDPAPVRRAVEAWQATHPWFGATYLDEAAVAAAEPSLAPGVVACRLDIGFPVAPAAATRALAGRALRLGVDVREGSPAVPAVVDGRVVGVEIDGGTEPAGAVILATGPSTAVLADPSGRWRPIRPFWGVVVDVALDRPPRHVLEGAGIEDAIGPGELRAPRSPEEADGIVDFSLVTAAGRTSLGSTFLPQEPDPDTYVAPLVAGGAAWVPGIAAAPVRGVRACARPLSLDGRPLVGAMPGTPGLIVAAGHGPWGISTGPASGAHAAALALGDAAGVPAAIRAAVDPGRFGTAPGA